MNGASTSPAAAVSHTILVVDDVSVDRRLASRCLQRVGYHVELAYDGSQALEVLRRRPVDLVLIDVNMPVMNGFETLDEIKADPELCHTPVILMSSDGGGEEAGARSQLVRSIERGAAHFLKKPIDNDQLKLRVREVLSTTASAGSSVRQAPSNPVVLCVDDQKPVRLLVRRFLRAKQYKVELAADGKEAISILDKRRTTERSKPAIDLILLDLTMPVMDGKAVLAVLKNDPEWCSIPVIVFTSDETDTTATGMLALGADDVVHKPITADSLTARVYKVLESQRLRAWVAKQFVAAEEPSQPKPVTGQPIVPKNPVTAPAGGAGMMMATSGSMMGGSKMSATAATPSASAAGPPSMPDPATRELIERLQRENALLKERVLSRSREVETMESATRELQRQYRMADQELRQTRRLVDQLQQHDRELRVSIQQSQFRIQSLILEATERGYIPTIFPQPSSSVLIEDTVDVQMKAQVLFSACPDYVMPLHSEEMAKLTHEVCGYPKYFARVLFDRIRQYSRKHRADFLAYATERKLELETERLFEYSGIQLDDFIQYWQELLDANLSDRVGRFWHLVKHPSRTYLVPSDLRPLIESLVEFHSDLAAFRADPVLLEAYTTTVLTSLFCSLHGQRNPRITLAEMKGSNLLEAFDLVEDQTTRDIHPFCIGYFNDIFSQYKLLDRTGTNVVTKAQFSEFASDKIAPYVVSRIFDQIPRPFVSGSPGAMSYADFVWLWLAEKDHMCDTSIEYWFRCLDMDGDGLLSVDDLKTVVTLRQAGLTAESCPGSLASAPSAPASSSSSSSSSLPPGSPTAAAAGSGSGKADFGADSMTLSVDDALAQVFDLLNPSAPGVVSCLDIRRSGSGALLFDILIGMGSAAPPPASSF